MDDNERRRKRLSQLLRLAQTYQGWTRKELARALRRDPTKLIPGSGVPKLDLVVDLADSLDWSVDDVVDFLWERKPAAESANNHRDFETLDAAMRKAHRQGDYRLMIELSRQAFEVAENAEQRARACNREAGGWDGLGRYQNVLEAVQRGLQQRPVSAEFRRMLQSNLANAYYSLWSLVESRAIAAELIRHCQANPPESVRDRKTEAFAHYVCGHTHRRMITGEPEQAKQHAEKAERHLSRARELYLNLSEDLKDGSFAGIANTCKGGITEVQVTSGALAPEAALQILCDGLEQVDEKLVGDRLESFGWWCIFGCNIALRHLQDEKTLQRYMALYTTKADDIADRTGNWSIRERVFTMDHARWERAVGCSGFDIPRVVDEEDVRIITGTMARFPTFRDTGWRILRSAKVVRAN